MRKKPLISTVILCGLLWLGSTSSAQATVLPDGGKTLGTAVELTTGSFEGGSLTGDDVDYYKISINPGQKLKARISVDRQDSGWMNGNLMDSNEEDFTSATVLGLGDRETVAWLYSSDSESWAYLKFDSERVTEGSIDYSLLVELEDYYDANQYMDAGSNAADAIALEYGKYTGYLSDTSIWATGSDGSDYYEMDCNKGTVNFSLTAEDGQVGLELFDANRSRVFSEEMNNEGEILTKSLGISRAGTIYVRVYWDEGSNDDGILQYSLTSSTGESQFTESNIADSEEDLDFVVSDEDLPVEGDGDLTVAQDNGEKMLGGRVIAIVIFSIVLIVLIIALIIVVVSMMRKNKEKKGGNGGVSEEKSIPIEKAVDTEVKTAIERTSEPVAETTEVSTIPTD